MQACVAGLDVLHQAGDSRRAEDLRRPRRLQRVNVGSVLHLMRQQFVARTMAGQKQPGLVAQARLGVRPRRIAGRCGGSIRSSITLPGRPSMPVLPTLASRMGCQGERRLFATVQS